MSPDSARRAPERRERWVVAARVAFGATLLWAVLLGSRLPGTFPVAAYAFGPLVLTAGALIVLVVGVVQSARRPPLDGRRWRAFLLLALIIGGSNLPFPFPSRHEVRTSAVPYRLPLDGEWTVVWGGPEPERNLPARLRADRRFGLDLVRVEAGSTRAGAGAGPSAHLAFGAVVRAPAAGRVVAVSDAEPDAELAERRGGWDPGNHVVLATAPGEFVFLSPLARGSARVGPGDAVQAGDELGRVGHSGRNPFVDEPHLSMHVQDTPRPFWGQPVPWRLHDVVVDGRPVERAIPEGGLGPGGGYVGQRVANRAALPDEGAQR